MSWARIASPTFMPPEVGGTHPALIEAMGRGALVLYRDNAENAEVAGGAGIPFGRRPGGEDGTGAGHAEERRNELRRRALERVRRDYCWDAVATQYERLFQFDNEMMLPPFALTSWFRSIGSPAITAMCARPWGRALR